MSSSTSYFVGALLVISFLETISLLNLELTNCLYQRVSESHVTLTDPPGSVSKSGVTGADPGCPAFYVDARDPDTGSHAHVRGTQGHRTVSLAPSTIL